MNPQVMTDAAVRPNNLTAMTMTYAFNFFNEMGLGVANGAQTEAMTRAILHVAMNTALKASKEE